MEGLGEVADTLLTNPGQQSTTLSTGMKIRHLHRYAPTGLSHLPLQEKCTSFRVVPNGDEGNDTLSLVLRDGLLQSRKTFHDISDEMVTSMAAFLQEKKYRVYNVLPRVKALLPEAIRNAIEESNNMFKQTQTFLDAIYGQLNNLQQFTDTTRQSIQYLADFMVQSGQSQEGTMQKLSENVTQFSLLAKQFSDRHDQSDRRHDQSDRRHEKSEAALEKLQEEMQELKEKNGVKPPSPFVTLKIVKNPTVETVGEDDDVSL